MHVNNKGTDQPILFAVPLGPFTAYRLQGLQIIVPDKICKVLS